MYKLLVCSCLIYLMAFICCPSYSSGQRALVALGRAETEDATRQTWSNDIHRVKAEDGSSLLRPISVLRLWISEGLTQA